MSLKRLYKLIPSSSANKSSKNITITPSSITEVTSTKNNGSDDSKEYHHNEYITSVISEEFDSEYYLANYPDVAEAKINPIDHWLEYGWKERRNPNRHFNTESYLLANKDVLKANIDPFYHYLAAGRAENRPLTIDTEKIIPEDPAFNTDRSADDIFFEYQTIKNEFDSDYYLITYPDVLDYPYEPIWHFIYHGWKENRNPTPLFNTGFYVSDNPDVLRAGINPFYHYLVAGKNERRYISQPGGDKALTLYNLKTKNEIREAWKRQTPELVITQLQLHSLFKSSLKNRNIISLSHDAYLQHTGGIQLCIGIEQKNAQLAGICYIHLAPYQPLPFLNVHHATDDFFFEISLDGNYIGVAKHSTIHNVLSEQDASFDLIIHALHGHSPSCLETLFNSLKIDKAFLWIHDYFTICEGYNLLRNNITFCNAPSADSQSCNICIHGDERNLHLDSVKKILGLFHIKAISPSALALSIWKNNTEVIHKHTEVIEHVQLLSPKKRNDLNSSQNRKIRIGFIGFPSFHKGWGDFSTIVRQFLTNKRYHFFHFSRTDTKALPIEFVETNTNSQNYLSTTNAIASSDIDIIFIPACWPETFNFTCYEAIAGGAKIITYSSSGNVANYVTENNHGIVVDNVSDVIALLNDELPLALTSDRFYYNIKHSKMTLDSKEFNK